MEEDASSTGRSKRKRKARAAAAASGEVGMLGLLLLLLLALCGAADAATDPADTTALVAVKAALVDPNGVLSNWVPGNGGSDPCAGWYGIFCETDSSSVSHVEEIRLFRVGLQGTLAPEVGNLQFLRSLNLEWNNITGGLPPSIGNLSNLELLLVNGNNMSGPLPPELGRLAKLNRIQIDQNRFSGAIPAELGNLPQMQHLHMNNNSLEGQIPAVLGSLPSVVHILLDNNRLAGALPPELAKAPFLKILQLDNNPLASQRLPPSYSIMSNLVKLSLRNCNLQGPGVTDLAGLPALEYLDLSFNNLTGGLPNLSAAVNLSAAILSGNRLQQNVSGLSIARELPNLQALLVARNGFSGDLDAERLLGPVQAGGPSRVLNFQNNRLDSFDRAPPNVSLWVAGNPNICQGQAAESDNCTPRPDDSLQVLEETVHQNDDLVQASACETQTNCTDPRASPKLIRGRCLCLYALQVGLRLKSPSFTMFAPLRVRFTLYLAEAMTNASAGKVVLAPDQVSVVDYTWLSGPRLLLNLRLFPDPGPQNDNRAFTTAQVDAVYDVLANWRLRDDRSFGPKEFMTWNPSSFYIGAGEEDEHHEKRGIAGGAVVGIVVGAVAATAVVAALLGLYYYRWHEKELFRRGRRGRHVGADEERLRSEMRSKVRVTGLREFSYDDMARATDNFSADRRIGQGGYGMVYLGHVESGDAAAGDESAALASSSAKLGLVAIKRAHEGSLQGARQFYTEIELLSRVHHRNLVRLIGYCDDEGEQMLVYEFMQGGTLRDRLNRNPAPGLASRLRIALGAARGIAYLHNDASPPIFHRDIKTSNVLLDAKGVAKVADFGLSKLATAPDTEGAAPGAVCTVVKGTPGYLDPEYFLTHQLTDKSDVYSFGVVLLELVTGLPPISNGRNIVREVLATVAGNAAGGLFALVDSRMGPYPPQPVEHLIRLALSCCSDSPDKRPNILEVVRELEDIWKDADFESHTIGSDTTSHSNFGSLPSSGFFTDPSAASGLYSSGSGGLASRTVVDLGPR